jgi:SPP1 family predicted phage head-tail adaptor
MERQDNKKSLATELRCSVWIRTRVAVADEEGGEKTTWKNRKQVFAAIYPIQARQQFQYKSIGVEATHLVKMRGLIDVAETEELEFNNRRFEILTIENIQERDFVKIITCKERRP